MKKNSINYYLPFKEVVMRTPLLPFLYKDNCDFENPIFREALYLSSPDFYNICENLGGKFSQKGIMSLYKYWRRVATRCTPFGLFAGTSIGMISDKTNIIRVHPEEVHRKSRLDMYYLCALIQHFESLPNIRVHLHYFPNDSIYYIGRDKIRYVEIYYMKDVRAHNLQEVDFIPQVKSILKAAQSGATIQQLAHSIECANISHKEALSFVEELINNQLLKSEIEANITGNDPFSELIDWFSSKKSLKLYYDKLVNIYQCILDIDKSLYHDNNAYSHLYKAIESFDIKYNKKFLLQTDTFIPSHCELSAEYVKRIQKCLNFLIKVNGLSSYNSPILDFERKFIERYESQPVWLLNVLDGDTGLGYPIQDDGFSYNPIIERLRLPMKGITSGISLSLIELIVLQKYLLNCRTNGDMDCVTLTDDDFYNFVIQDVHLSSTVSVLCQISSNTKKPCIYFKSVGAYPTRIIGRFCPLHEKITHLAKDICNKEKELMKGNALLAEIVHIPDSRLGNVAFRPLLREYDIHYLAKSGQELSKSLPVSDLMLKYINNRLILYSSSLSREIRPRLSNAHNYKNDSTPVYRFLCDYQYYHVNSPELFSLYKLLAITNYIPRVCFENCILSLQTWRVRYNDVIGEKNVTAEKNITMWRHSQKIPYKVNILDGDNKLYIDFTDPLSTSVFLDILKKRKIIDIEEPYFMEDDMVANDGTSVYNSEFLLSFYMNDQIW